MSSILRNTLKAITDIWDSPQSRQCRIINKIKIAIKSNNSIELNELIKANIINLNTRYSQLMNRTILLLACDMCKIECVKVLLDNNDIKLFDLDRVLASAGLSGNVELFNCLLDYIIDHGLQLNDSVVLNCFQTLANTNRLDNIEIATRLLSHVKDVNFTQHRNLPHSSFLYLACGSGNCELVRILLGRGADRSDESHDGKDALYIAAHCAHLGAVRLLFEWEGDDKISTSSISTALSAACTQGHIEVVRFLIENGASLNVTNEYGYTLLAQAVGAPNGKYYALVVLLIEYGADVDARDTRATPLVVAVQYGRSDLVELLLNNGADINLGDTNTGNTPLMTASLHQSTVLVKLLLERGADVTQVNRDGHDALDLLKGEKDCDQVRRIRKLCEVYLEYSQGMKPLLK